MLAAIVLVVSAVVAGNASSQGPCALLTVEEVESVTGRTVTSHGFVPDERMLPPADGPNPCLYEMGGKHGSISVFALAGGASEFHRDRDRDPLNTESVHGVGDEAYVHALVNLGVLSDGRYFVFVTRYGVGWDGIEDLKSLALLAIDDAPNPGPTGA